MTSASYQITNTGHPLDVVFTNSANPPAGKKWRVTYCVRGYDDRHELHSPLLSVAQLLAVLSYNVMPLRTVSVRVDHTS